MAKKAPASSAWDVRLSEDKRLQFTEWLCQEIINAEAARTVMPEEVRYWWQLYEQARTRNQSLAPWQDAADLTSYFGTEKVDALKARIMRTLMVDPVYTVEGWGQSAAKAPFVEDFHQWTLETEGLQGFLSRVMLAGLIEPRAVLEAYEDTTERPVRKEISAKLAMTPDGRFQLDEQLEPILEQDADGNYVEVMDDEGGTIATAATVIDSTERVRRGPNYRVLDYEHFLVLPGNAREKADIWGYAKKFTKGWDVLQEGAKAGLYDKKAIDALTDSPDVASQLSPSGQNIPVANQSGSPTGDAGQNAKAQKELWEVQLLVDLNGKGLRWYVATVHVGQRQLLRLKHDSVGRGRYVIFVPYPRTDRCHEGYSFVGHKLVTVIEDHTAFRNAGADRDMLNLSAPIKRLSGALWDPDDQPFGPKSVIDVRDMNEVQVMQIPPQPESAWRREQEIVQAAERVAGINDVAAGMTPQTSRTLGETNLVAEQSFVRMDDVIKALLEPMEELGQIRQAIWIATLKEKGESGMPAPESLMSGRGGDITNGKDAITWQMLEGTFRFKPRGSSETADKARMRGDYIQFMQGLAILMKTWPALAGIIGNNMQAAKSAMEQFLRLFNVPDKQAWIGNADQWQAPPPMPPGMPGMPPGAPGAPPGGPPGLPPGLPPELAQMMGGGAPPPSAGA